MAEVEHATSVTDAANAGLREGRAARTPADRAWAYRRAIDAVALLVAQATTPDTDPTGHAQ